MTRTKKKQWWTDPNPYSSNCLLHPLSPCGFHSDSATVSNPLSLQFPARDAEKTQVLDAEHATFWFAPHRYSSSDHDHHHNRNRPRRSKLQSFFSVSSVAFRVPSCVSFLTCAQQCVWNFHVRSAPRGFSLPPSLLSSHSIHHYCYHYSYCMLLMLRLVATFCSFFLELPHLHILTGTLFFTILVRISTQPRNITQRWRRHDLHREVAGLQRGLRDECAARDATCIWRPLKKEDNERTRKPWRPIYRVMLWDLRRARAITPEKMQRVSLFRVQKYFKQIIDASCRNAERHIHMDVYIVNYPVHYSFVSNTWWFHSVKCKLTAQTPHIPRFILPPFGSASNKNDDTMDSIFVLSHTPSPPAAIHSPSHCILWSIHGEMKIDRKRKWRNNNLFVNQTILKFTRTSCDAGLTSTWHTSVSCWRVLGSFFSPFGSDCGHYAN